MAAFKALRDVSNNFEAEIRSVSAGLFSAKIGESFEDVISKKTRDLSLYTSKLRLLRAKPMSINPQITEEEKNNEIVINNYEELATTKVLEQQIVKVLTQSHAVKEIITTADSSLHPELADRKQKITQTLAEYRNQESYLRHLYALLKDKEEQLASVKVQWDKNLGELRDMKEGVDDSEEMDTTSPLDKMLCTLVDKMEMMKWLLGKLVTARTSGYDWLSDPHNRLSALGLARTANTIEMFTESN